LFQHLAQPVGRASAEVAVHTTMRVYDQRLFPATIQIPGNKHVCSDPERIPRALCRGIRLVSAWRAGELHHVDVSDIADTMKECDVIYAAVDAIDLVPQTLELPFQHGLDLLDLLGTLRGQSVR
jgi:hypothetical protein